MSATNNTTIPNKVFQDILNSCSVITMTSLSCKTFGNEGESINTNLYCENDDDDDDDDDDCRITDWNNKNTEKDNMNITRFTDFKKEYEIGKWLDEQIEDYKAALIRQKSIYQQLEETSKQSNYDEDIDGHLDVELALEEHRKRQRRRYHKNIDNKKQKLETLKQDLFDESVQRDQEHLLIHRIQMSAASSKYVSAYPPDQYSTPTIMSNALKKDVKTSTLDRTKSQKYYLMKESLRLRDDQVLKAIQNLNEMNKQKDNLMAITKNCYEIKDKNYKLWNHDVKQLRNHDPSITNSTKSNYLYVDNDASKELKRLNKEIELFKASYMCIIAATGINWYFDDRLCQTMCKLED